MNPSWIVKLNNSLDRSRQTILTTKRNAVAALASMVNLKS